MHAPTDDPTFEPSQDEREEDGLGFEGALDVADVATNLDSCVPGWLDLDCFDVSDCGLDCAGLDCGL